MQGGRDYCTISYKDDSYSVPLPDTLPPDFHAFVKEELVAAGAQDVFNRDIQVEAVGMNLPDMLSPSFAVRPGSYRVTLRQLSDKLQKQHWKLTLRLPCLNKVDYWADKDAIPGALNLQLSSDMTSVNTADLVERRRHYTADRQPLEAAFYQFYQQKRVDLKFGISSDPEQTQQSAQWTFLRELCEHQLMLRVRNFALGKELLLRVSKTDSSLCGYIEDNGIVEQLALQEFEAFVKLAVPQLVLVLDLDQTIVHTPPHGSAEQQVLAGHVGNGRAFNVCCKGPWQLHEQMICAPRAYLVQFFISLFQKYHVMYCTAGAAEYGIQVVRNLRAFMLGTAGASLDEHQQRWITNCTDSRRLVSTRTICPKNRNFKSLGMLLKMAYVPEYVQQIVIILDDNPHVWTSPVDHAIASLIPVPRQRLVTSDTCARPWLQVFSDLAKILYLQAFAHGSPTKGLREVLRDVGLQLLQNELRNGGH